jgi:peptidyl-prolyl cis-trans isomerase A (cyclophilin A)
MKSWIALALLACSTLAHAQNQRVLLDTDRGPVLVELDQTRAPITSANFLAYVDAKTFDKTLVHRVVKNFIVQMGGYKEDTTPVIKRPNIASERTNGLLNTTGTLAMALTSSNGLPNTASANSEFFFNMANNTQLDGSYTVFGRVLFGMKTLTEINNTTLYGANGVGDAPVRMPLVKRAVRTDGFPILDLHTGGWYDPAKNGRGFSVEVANGSETGALLVVYWYDYFEGKQIWMNGVKTFAWGDSQVVVPMQITRGGQFGSAFVPGDVVSDNAWGTLTVRFTACDRAPATAPPSATPRPTAAARWTCSA